APDRILVGEARDAETMEASIEAANTGHWVGTTTHAADVKKSIRRMTSCFSGDDRGSNLVVLVENLRLIVNQMLVPSAEGKRVALREYLIFDREVQDSMLAKVANPDEMPIVAGDFVRKRGNDFSTAARRAFKDGLISADVRDFVLKSQNSGGERHVA
ncbi:MAG: Flp pilus assembly complex ATPase component TadA, partial [Azospirillum sp.]|nr:Flp pilus assembly complex ATPase component TadA [Azospirillum sp.]